MTMLGSNISHSFLGHREAGPGHRQTFDIYTILMMKLLRHRQYFAGGNGYAYLPDNYLHIKKERRFISLCLS